MSGLSFEPTGIVFPFKTATKFRSAYACVARVFKPLLDEAGLTKDKWGFKVLGGPVEPTVAVDPAVKVEPTEVEEPTAAMKGGTNPDIWPSSVPLKLARGIRFDKGCGLWVKGNNSMSKCCFHRGCPVSHWCWCCGWGGLGEVWGGVGGGVAVGVGV